MQRPRLLLVGLLGIALPVALAFAAYVLSSASLGQARPIPVPTGPVGQGNPDLVLPSAAPSPGEDVSGNCDEAEHRGDPECAGASPRSSGEGSGDDGAGSGSSGSGSGSDDSRSGSDDSRSDSSGSGSDDSRSGSSGGDSDNSGPGSENSGRGGDD